MFLWLKALHIIAVVCWFAGIFYLPRLFVYHAQTSDEAGNQRFKIMERKLFRGIMTPAAVISVGLGMWMVIDNMAFYRTQIWMHIKLTLVLLLIIYHIICWFHLKAFAENRNTRSHVYFRIFNEIPVLLLVAIVILVVVRPI